MFFLKGKENLNTGSRMLSKISSSAEKYAFLYAYILKPLFSNIMSFDKKEKRCSQAKYFLHSSSWYKIGHFYKINLFMTLNS